MRQKAYVNLVAWHKKGKSSGGNLSHAAWRAGIDNPRALTLLECWAGVKACKKLLMEQEKQASPLRREHLRNRYKLASDLKDTTKCAKIMDIIKREEQQDEWRQIKQATGDPQTGTTNLVQQMEGNIIVDILKALAMNKEIQKVTENWFDLAQSMPATSSSLRNLVSYNADMTFAKDLLQHNVPIPPDVDTITADLIEEMCCLSGHVHVCPMDRWRSHQSYINIIGGVSMKQHPWLSLAFTLGTRRFFIPQVNSFN
jgi:hypothetical protein